MNGFFCVVFVVFCIGSFAFLMWFLAAVSGHADDLAKIRNGAEILGIAKRYCDELSKKLEVVDGALSGGVLANKDSPIGALISAYSSAQQKLMYAERDIADARVRIAARKAGLFPFVVAWYGEE